MYSKSMVPFIGGSYDSLNKRLSSQNCINCYPQIEDSQNVKSQYSLVGTAGSKLYADLQPSEQLYKAVFDENGWFVFPDEIPTLGGVGNDFTIEMEVDCTDNQIFQSLLSNNQGASVSNVNTQKTNDRIGIRNASGAEVLGTGASLQGKGRTILLISYDSATVTTSFFLDNSLIDTTIGTLEFPLSQFGASDVSFGTRFRGDFYNLKITQNAASLIDVSVTATGFYDSVTATAFAPSGSGTTFVNYGSVPVVGQTFCRGIFTSATGSMFTVYDTTLYKIDSPTQTTIIATNIGGSIVEDVSFAENLEYLQLCDGIQMYKYRFSDGYFDTVAYPAQPKQIVWLKGRFLAINSGPTPEERNKVYYSEAGLTGDSGVTWNSSAFFVAEQSADSISSIIVSNGFAWLFGDRSYEVHEPTGLSTDPFDLMDSTTNSIGCNSDTTEIGDIIFFLGTAQVGTQQIFMTKGFSAVPISTVAIEGRLADFVSKGKDLSDVKVDSYSQAGHLFVVFTFIGANYTIVYDLTTNLWHQRARYDNTTPSLDRSDYFYYNEFDNNIITGAPNGKLLSLDVNTYDEYDEANGTRPLVMEYTAPVYWDSLNKISIVEFMIDINTGYEYLYNDPKVIIESSRDGGYTFRNSRFYDIAGNVTLRVRKLGMSREHVIRMRISDPIPRQILGARITQYTGVGS